MSFDIMSIDDTKFLYYVSSMKHIYMYLYFSIFDDERWCLVNFEDLFFLKGELVYIYKFLAVTARDFLGQIEFGFLL